MTSRRVHDDSRFSKKEAELDSSTREEGGNSCNYTRAASSVSTCSQFVSKQSKAIKVAEIANIETSCYYSASVCSRASRG